MGRWNNLLQEILLGGKQCVYCGREIAQEELICGECRIKEEQFKNKDGFAGGILYAYRYEDIVRKLIHQFKYNDMPRLSMFIAQRMAEFLNDYDVHADLIAYVPIHKNRLRVRGYDQTEMIAQHLGLLMGMPCSEVLVRTRDTSPQYRLSAQDRWKNIHKAFALKDGVSVEGKNILLVDDIYTTGTTVGECMKVLADAGANVMVFTYSKEFPKAEFGKKRK